MAASGGLGGFGFGLSNLSKPAISSSVLSIVGSESGSGSVMSVHHSKYKELYDKLNADLTTLEEQHAKIPRPHVEPATGFYNELIAVYENIEKKCLAFLSELAKSPDHDTDRMIDTVLTRLDNNLRKTEIAFRGRATMWGQPSYDGTRTQSHLHNQYQYVSSQLYTIFLKYYLDKHRNKIPSVAMSKYITDAGLRDNPLFQITDNEEIKRNPSFENARRLAERAAFVQITKKRYEEVDRMNRELQKKNGGKYGKYVAYVNENPQAPDHEYFYYDTERRTSSFDPPEITEQYIQREQQELRTYLNSMLVDASEKSRGIISSYYLTIHIRYSGSFEGWGYSIMIPFKRNEYPETFSDIISIMKKFYGESFVQPTFKNRKATRPIFFLNSKRFKGYNIKYTFGPNDVIEMKYPLFENWDVVSSLVRAAKGGKHKKRRTNKKYRKV